MFRFNFVEEGGREEKEENGNEERSAEPMEEEGNAGRWLTMTESLAQELSRRSRGSVHAGVLGLGAWTVPEAEVAEVWEEARGGVVEAATAEECDVRAGEYEGGLKVWECSRDLVRLLHSLPEAPKGCRVAELGCGLSLPALYIALHWSPRALMLQDYNAEALMCGTVPTFLRNGASWALLERASWYAGSWSSLARQASLPAGEYDLVLSAETLYTTASYPSLHAALQRCLARPNGVAYFATKSYYFGVAEPGSVFEFIHYLDRVQSPLHCEILQSFQDGLSNQRSILKLHWKQ